MISCKNAHTGLHRALSSLDKGDSRAAKEEIARQIQSLTNALLIL